MIMLCLIMNTNDHIESSLKHAYYTWTDTVSEDRFVEIVQFFLAELISVVG